LEKVKKISSECEKFRWGEREMGRHGEGGEGKDGRKAD
jgi:hypothetical protein